MDGWMDAVGISNVSNFKLDLLEESIARLLLVSGFDNRSDDNNQTEARRWR
jgi:hypothetical protein